MYLISKMLNKLILNYLTNLIKNKLIINKKFIQTYRIKKKFI